MKLKLVAMVILTTSCGIEEKMAVEPETVPESVVTTKAADVPEISAPVISGPQTLYIDALVDLPTCGPGNVRQLIYVAETTDFRACLGNDWTVVDVKGKDGADGAPGEIGADGKEGEAGIAGIDGQNGANGIDGLNGAVGATGAQGNNGVAGQTGQQGAKGDTGTFVNVVVTPEMPKYHFVHAATNNLDNKLGTLDYYIYGARIIDLGNGTLYLTFSGYGNGDGVFSHSRIVGDAGAFDDFYHPTSSGAPVLRVTINSVTSITIERTQSQMSGTATTFTLIAE